MEIVQDLLNQIKELEKELQQDNILEQRRVMALNRLNYLKRRIREERKYITQTDYVSGVRSETRHNNIELTLDIIKRDLDNGHIITFIDTDLLIEKTIKDIVDYTELCDMYNNTK